MKRFFLLTGILFLLCGCSRLPEERTISVGITEIPGCVVSNNGQQAVPGEDVFFELILEEGYALTGVDYRGDYTIYQENGKLQLRLKNVRYPTRLQLQLTQDYCTLTYDPNGGSGEPITHTRDLRYHCRPNTAVGLFDRDGYTLVGWNTEPDGSGTAVGLGSRVTNTDTGCIRLYAQWIKWNDESDFSYILDETVTITAYHGGGETIVVPEMIQGKPVTVIAPGAFQTCAAAHIVLPKTLVSVKPGAFVGCALRELTFFDNIETLTSDCFVECPDFAILHINAQEPPYGYHYRRESMLADKIDLMILHQGQKKIVFYGGCSMWYNLDGPQMQKALGDAYQVINAAVNGTINSAVQLQIITAWLEDGDIFFHTPELSSDTQLMIETGFTEDDAKLWCGLEYNYDLLEAVDLRQFPGLLDSNQQWRDQKKDTGSYDEYYRDPQGRSFFDPATGSIPFERTRQAGELADAVELNPGRLKKENMDRLADYYEVMTEKGVTVYLSYACINMDALPSEQQGGVMYMDTLFKRYMNGAENVKVISYLGDYLYHNEDFFDTNYHLLSGAARRNTAKWLRDLEQQMESDGLWPE